jgi:hypothetical protein
VVRSRWGGETADFCDIQQMRASSMTTAAADSSLSRGGLVSTATPMPPDTRTSVTGSGAGRAMGHGYVVATGGNAAAVVVVTC